MISADLVLELGADAAPIAPRTAAETAAAASTGTAVLAGRSREYTVSAGTKRPPGQIVIDSEDDDYDKRAPKKAKKV